jgi:hypothetical protein
MSNSNSPAITALCKLRLGEISDVDIADLTEFAEWCLVVRGASPFLGDDVVQRAFLAVLKGLKTDQGGRKPRLVDLQDKAAFVNYLRGAVSSIAYNTTRTSEFRVSHKPWYDEMTGVPEDDEDSPARAAEWADLISQLFPRLRAQAPRRLIPTINKWEPVFRHSDRIPAPGHRRYVREVRDLAQKILSALGGIR